MRGRSIFDRIAHWSLVSLVFLAPFFVVPVAWVSVDQAKVFISILLLFVALICFAVARLSEGVLFVPRSALLYTAPLLPLAYLLSALGAHAPLSSYASGIGTQDTVAALALLAGVWLLTALASSSQDAKTRRVLVRRFFAALLCGIAIVALFQIARLFVPQLLSLGGLMQGASSSIVGSWHDLGILFGVGVLLPSILMSAEEFSRGYRAVLLALLGIFSFLMLLVVNAADVWFTLSAVSFLLALAMWRAAHQSRTRSALVHLCIALVALSAAFGGTYFAGHLPPNLQVDQTEVRPSWQGTFTVAEQVFHDHGLIFGSGPNTFTRAWGEFKPSGVNQTQFWNSDFETGVGTVPTAIITAGLLGALAWLLLGLALFSYALGAFIHRKLDRAHPYLSSALAGALFLFVFHVIYAPGFALSALFFFFLGLLVVLSEDDRAPSRLRLSFSYSAWREVGRVGALFVGVVIVSVAGAYTLRSTLSDVLVAKSASDYSGNADLPHSLALIRAALALDPKSTLARRAGVELGVLQLQQMAAAGKTSDSAALQAALKDTIAEGLAAVSIDSGDYQNWLTLAEAYHQLGGAGLSGAYDNARAAYEKSAAANPGNPLPLVGAAQVAMLQNDASSSRAYLDSAIRIKPDLAAAYFLRSQVEVSQGDYSAALNDGRVAVALVPQDPLGWYNLGVVLYSAKDFADAAISLKQSVALSNNYANALFLLSLSLENSGDHLGALAMMQKVVDLNPDNETAKEALAGLEAKNSPDTKPQ